MNARDSFATALVRASLCVLATIAFAMPASADDSGAARPAAAAPATNVQDIPAVVQFEDRDVYRGDVRLDYGTLPTLPEQDATVTFDDRKRHKRGYVAIPNGRGTFTSRSGLTFTDTQFVDGRAYGPGVLTVPSVAGTGGLTFDGTFLAGAPLYGTVQYAGGASYRGYLADGCFAAAPATVPDAPADAPAGADFFSRLPSSPGPDVFTESDGLTVTGTWQHVAGSPCSASPIAGARVAYPGGERYVGDLDAAGHYTGFGALYEHARPADVLLCGTRSAGAAFVPGTYAVTIGRFGAPGDDAHAICNAPRDDVTTMAIAVTAPTAELDGRASVRFANGDRANGYLRAGVLDGPGTYLPATYAATISGTFHSGRLASPASIADPCGRTYPAVVRDGMVRNAPSSRTAYLFRGCDWFAMSQDASLAVGAIPSGHGTEHLSDGETIAANWHDGRPTGHVVVRVRRPFAAVVDIPNARESGVRITGKASIRFDNGDVARGTLDAPLLDVSWLEGPGDYRFASSGCTARGTFHHGKLRGSAVLDCPNAAPYAGEIGSDGSVQ